MTAELPNDRTASAVMMLDVITSVLSHPDDLPDTVRHLSQKIRELTGSRVTILAAAAQHADTTAGYLIMDINPPRHASIIETREGKRLVEIALGLGQAALWQAGAGKGEAEAILARMGFPLSLGMPLMTHGEIGGAILSLGLMDEGFVGPVMELQDILSRAVSIVLKNSLLIEEQKRSRERLEMEISERKRAEEALRRSENTYRTIFENSGTALMIIEEDLSISLANTQCEKLSGYSRHELEAKENWTALVLEEDLRRMREFHALRMIDPQSAPAQYELQFVDRQGDVKNVIANVAVIPQTKKTLASLTDITRRKEAEELLSIERDFALGLGSAGSLPGAMELALQACLKIGALDSGGIYLVERETGALSLICHRGLADGFVKRVSSYVPSSPQARFVMRGEPGYWSSPAGILETGDLLEREGLLAFAVIPVKAEGEVVASLSLGSHLQCEISSKARSTLETIAAQIGGVACRSRLAEDLNAESARLQEANTALKVLLKHREEDRAELEGAILENVRHLVLPYVEKLRKSRLTDDQRLFLEVLETHLKEVTSSFVHKMSTHFIGFTPTEIRVSDLIRQGKSSKEIGELLGTSERAILFHRQSIRGKLGLKRRKVNLRYYLATIK